MIHVLLLSILSGSAPVNGFAWDIDVTNNATKEVRSFRTTEKMMTPTLWGLACVFEPLTVSEFLPGERIQGARVDCMFMQGNGEEPGARVMFSTFTQLCTDAGRGKESCPWSKMLTGEGALRAVTGDASVTLQARCRNGI